jgi:hypothetical protein
MLLYRAGSVQPITYMILLKPQGVAQWVRNMPHETMVTCLNLPRSNPLGAKISFKKKKNHMDEIVNS